MIVCLTGAPRAGKNTVVNRLVESHGFTPMSLSDAPKKLFHDLCGGQYRDEAKDDPVWQGNTARNGYIHLFQLERWNRNVWIDQLIDEIDMIEAITRPNGGWTEEAREPDIVIESIGRQFQYDRLLERSPIRRIALLNVRRPGYEYTDGREDIFDRDDHGAPLRGTGTIFNDSDFGWINTSVDCWLLMARGIPPRPRLAPQIRELEEA